MDFTKAIDTVWQYDIVYIIQSYRFKGQNCRTVGSFLKDRISHDSVITSCQRNDWLKRVLRPVLYNSFVSDIPGPHGRGLRLLYVDDIWPQRVNVYVCGFAKLIKIYIKKFRATFLPPTLFTNSLELQIQLPGYNNARQIWLLYPYDKQNFFYQKIRIWEGRILTSWIDMRPTIDDSTINAITL